MNWANRMIESKAFKIIIYGAFWTSIIIALLILFMVVNFIFKITLLDYRFDDGELKPSIVSMINNEQEKPLYQRED